MNKPATAGHCNAGEQVVKSRAVKQAILGAAVGLFSVASLVLVEFIVLERNLLPPGPHGFLMKSCDLFESPLRVLEQLSGLTRFHLPVWVRIFTAAIFYPVVGAVIGYTLAKVWRRIERNAN